MSRFAKSARGNLVDFDLLAIKQQIAAAPVSAGVNSRRKFIDEKDGLKSKVQTAVEEVVQSIPEEVIIEEPIMHEALAMASSGAEQSIKKTKK